MIERYTVDYLLQLLEQEFPPYTCGPHKCASCNKSARGYYCVDCLLHDLSRRGGKDLAEQLQAAHYKRFKLTEEVRQIEQRILEDAK